MVEERNFREKQAYNSSNTDGRTVTFNWKQPAQLFRWLVQFIRNPAGAVKQVVASDDIAQPLVLISINLISVFLAGIVCVIILNVRYSLYFSWIHIPSLGIIIFALLLAVIFDFGFPGLLFVSTSIIFKEKTSFYKMLSLAGSKVIIDSLFILAGSIGMLAGSFFFLLFVVAGNIFSLIILITVYNEENHLPQMKKVYSISISLTVIYIIMLIILKIFSLFLAGNIYSYINLF